MNLDKNIDNITDNIPAVEISPINDEQNIKIKSLVQTVTGTNSKLISSKSLTSKKWGMIEKPLSESDMKRNKIINELGEKSTNTTVEIINSSGLFTVGELNYLKIREDIKNLIKLPPLNNEKIKNEKKMNKVTKLKALISSTNSNALIEIDGGVNLLTGKSLADAGANALVAGSFVFNSVNPSQTIADLKAL